MIDKLIEVLSYNPKEPMIFSSGLFLLAEKTHSKIALSYRIFLLFLLQK